MREQLEREKSDLDLVRPDWCPLGKEKVEGNIK